MTWDKNTVRTIIFEADTPAGKAFDVGLLIAILVSVIAVMLDTVDRIHQQYGDWLYLFEWFLTILFVIEYGLRLWCIDNKRAYATSFYGVIDLLGILPAFISLIVPGAQHLLVVRILRVLRVFRVLRMVRYVGEADTLRRALVSSRRKISVFILGVMAMVVIFGSLMYLVEGEANGFTSIPLSIYWAVITLTTVGYGDLVPLTPLGQAIASIVMIMGYGVIAVPTGIVTMELNEANKRQPNTRTCPYCAAEGHNLDAIFCWRCGHHLYRSKDKPARIEPGLIEIPPELAESPIVDSAADSPAADSKSPNPDPEQT